MRAHAISAVLVVTGFASASLGEDIMSDAEMYEKWAAYMEESIPSWEYHKTKWGEGIGWYAAPALRGLSWGYEYSREERWLKMFVKMADELFARLKEERGHPGWGHSITGEALVLEAVLHWIHTVKHDEAAAEPYKKKADEYLKIVDPALLVKWEKMGFWRETHLHCGTFREGISLPHNKNAHVGMMLLTAALVTPDDERRKDYLDKSAKLIRRWHKFLKVKDDRYLWHYWDGEGPWDFKEDGASRHWTSLEHRGYGSADTAFAAMAYDFGLVLDKKDMEMHANTFLKEIWNGDEADPQYRPQGWFNPKYNKSSIYSALARFSPKILELLGRQLSKNPASWGGISGVPQYLLMKKRGVGFDRKYAEFSAKHLTRAQMSKLVLQP